MGLKILAFTAINPQRRFPQAEETIRALEGIETLVFDDGENGALTPYARMLLKYQRARQMVLDCGYDALLTCESDLYIPRDAAIRLMNAGGDVAYGLYCFRHGAPLWNAYVAHDGDYGVSLSQARDFAPQMLADARRGKVVTTYGVGFGCTLIRRRVLEQIEFRLDPARLMTFADWHFAYDCQMRGFHQVTDTSLICGHIADEGILYPDITQPDMVRVEKYHADTLRMEA